MKNPFYRLVVGFLSTALLGLLFAGLYGAVPMVVTAILAPNCQSPWELSKLAYFPLMLGILLTRWTCKDRLPWRADLMLLTLAGPTLFLLFWVTAPFVTGKLRLILWLVVLAGGFLLSGRAKEKQDGGLWKMLALALGLVYIIFTFLPPLAGPFLDPSTAAAMAVIPF